MSNEQVEGLSDQILELFRAILLIEPDIIAPIEVEESEHSGKRGVLGTPPYKEMTIKIMFMDNSDLSSEKMKQLMIMKGNLEADLANVKNEIEKLELKTARFAQSGGDENA